MSNAKKGLGSGMLLVSSALILAALPIFLIGGLAVQIRTDLGFDETTLGAIVTAGFAMGAIAAQLGGRLADRFGPRAAVGAGAVLSSIALVGIGGFASAWWHLVIFLAVSGLGVAITDPGLAILVGRVIPTERQGLAFGVKEASIPTATLLAGLAVPVIALTVGWRWAFSLGLVPLAIVVFLTRSVTGRGGVVVGDDEAAVAPNPKRPLRGPLIVVAVAAALGSAAASGVGVFITESAVAMGLTEASAGLVLAAGSVAGIIARVLAGVEADRRGGTQFKLIATMLGAGGLAILLGATGNTLLLVLGTIGAFTGGWAWTGIFFLSLVRTNPSAPGAAAGLGTASLGLGNAAGPLMFGLVAQAASFSIAWLTAGAVAGTAAVMMNWSRRRLEG
jgi:MFS family permease